MKKAQGFTLVELLVVIVIIGILATGSIAMFTGAQQKARDSVRITDIQAIKLAMEQSYGDTAAYPATDDSGIDLLLDNAYIDKIPSDPKSEERAGTGCLVYIYAAADEENSGVQGQEFELSAMFENAGNQNTKSAEDGGDDDGRWETGVNIDHVDSQASTTAAGDCEPPTTLGSNSYNGITDEAYVIDTYAP